MKSATFPFLLALSLLAALPAPQETAPDYARVFIQMPTIKGTIEVVVWNDDCVIRLLGGDGHWSSMIPTSALNLLTPPGNGDAVAGATFCIAQHFGGGMMSYGMVAHGPQQKVEILVHAQTSEQAVAQASQAIKDAIPQGWHPVPCN